MYVVTNTNINDVSFSYLFKTTLVIDVSCCYLVTKISLTFCLCIKFKKVKVNSIKIIEKIFNMLILN